MSTVAFQLVGRCENRWKVRVGIQDPSVTALTIGLVTEDGKPLGPALVTPMEGAGELTLVLAGPCTLPSGAQVRCTVDLQADAESTVGNQTVIEEFSVDQRHGVHAYLHGDGLLGVESTERGTALTPDELCNLSARFPWIYQKPKPQKTACCEEDDNLLSMLRDEFGVETDGEEEELLRTLKM